MKAATSPSATNWNEGIALSTGMKTVLIIFLAAAALAITVFAVTNRRGFSALILNAIGGAAALFAVNIAGLATGIQLSVNRWSLGAGALLSKCITSSEIVAYEDLGTEAIRKLTVVNLPVIVVIDSKGNNLYETAVKEYRKI